MLQQTEVLKAGIALLAFVLAFYGLAARDHRAPYAIRTVYSITYAVLLAIIFSFVAAWLRPIHKPTAKGADCIATILLAYGFVATLLRIWRIHNRHLNFRDDQLFLNLIGIRQVVSLYKYLKRTYRKHRSRPNYEHNPVSFPTELITSIKESPFVPDSALAQVEQRYAGTDSFAVSVACRVVTLSEIDTMLIDLAVRFLKLGFYVQYTTCTRHPREFLDQLERAWTTTQDRATWPAASRKIVVVDAYTPHFGFTDTIYCERKERAAEKCLKYILSNASYAGVHTSAARAFNVIKKSVGGDLRNPTLLVYEGMHALVDLESDQQYRLFVRHVVPSERLWGGMFTLFLESYVDEENLAMLRSVTDMFIDRAPKHGESEHEGGCNE